jgi:hypothetical protein
VDKETAAAYLTGVSDVPAWAIERACRDIGFKPRPDYETRWPELGVIRDHATAHLRHEAEKRETQRLLAAPPITPVAPEKLAKLRQDVEALIRRKAMK